jgi:hypothetical protein
MKKLLATTAIVSVSLASAALAETKVSGSIEQTFNSNSYDKAANQHKGTDSLGQETNVTFSSSKELDNGMKLDGAFRLEDSSIDMSMMKFSGENVSFTIGADAGQTIATTINPRVGDEAWNVTAVNAGDALSSFSSHDVQHVGVDFKAGGLNFNVNYAPSSNGIGSGDSSNTDSGGSGTEYSVAGSPIEGLNILVGQQTIEGENTTTKDTKEKTYQISYGQDAWAVGYSHRSYDDNDSTETAGTTDAVKYISATFAASDTVSLGVQHITATSEGSGTSAKDEETQSISVGYSLGPIGVEVMYAQTENAAHSSGDDQSGVQIRSVMKF